MSVETLPHSSFEVTKPYSAHEYSREHIEEVLEGILTATTLSEAREEQSVFVEIGRVFSEAHEAKVAGLQREMQEAEQKQNVILDAMMQNPAESFRAEFLQLKLLYGNRALTRELYDGSVNVMFCTQDHEQNRADFVFREYTSGEGTHLLEVVKSFTYSGEPRLGRVVWKNDELLVEERGWERGMYTDSTLEGEQRKRMLREMFTGTITASATQFERTADERDAEDRQAYLRLLEHLERQR